MRISKHRHTDDNALERVFLVTYPRLYAYACRFTECTEDAEDIVQDAFVKVIERGHLNAENDTDYLPIGVCKELIISNIEAYLFRAVRNGCLDYVKHRQVVMERILRLDDEELAEGLYQLDMMPNMEQESVYEELHRAIERLIEQMPERQREVFLLSRENDMKNKEIAERLNISIKAVEKHITAALKYLRENLSQEYLIILFLLNLH